MDKVKQTVHIHVRLHANKMANAGHRHLLSLFLLTLSELFHSLHLLPQQPRELDVQVSNIFNF